MDYLQSLRQSIEIMVNGNLRSGDLQNPVIPLGPEHSNILCNVGITRLEALSPHGCSALGPNIGNAVWRLM